MLTAHGDGMTGPVEVVLINPGDKRRILQGLGASHAAVEPPYWVAVLAAYLREHGCAVAVVDANAENLSPGETAARVARLDPLLAAVVVHGTHPSASTQLMTVAGEICRQIRHSSAGAIALAGLHPSALPERTVREEAVDFVVQGEGQIPLLELVGALRGGKDLSRVPGLWYRAGEEVLCNAPHPPGADLDALLPQAAWDLLPMHLYRAHNWHCFGDLEHRHPYAALHTSLGCPYRCDFCCINALYGKSGVRYRSPERVVEEIGHLVERHGVRHLKFIDELFILDERHYLSIAQQLAEKGYDLNIWAYARVDSIKPQHLPALKRAGINWLALGVETANAALRDGAGKRLHLQGIREVVDQVHRAGMHIIANYIFGLPEESAATMQETLDLAQELNCEFANFYCAMAYPGSRLYESAVAQGLPLPTSWQGFSQHSYELVPLPTRHLTPAEVLAFRDRAFDAYFTSPGYLAMMEETFGREARRHVEEMTRTRLKRKLLGD